MVQSESGPLSPAQRNSENGSSLLEALTWGDNTQTHPAEALFNLQSIEDMVIKGDIPEKVVTTISRMLWKAERYDIPVLRTMVKWYLLTRLGKDREARREYAELIVNTRRVSEEDEVR